MGSKYAYLPIKKRALAPRKKKERKKERKKQQKTRQTYGLPIKSDLISRGKQCHANTTEIDSPPNHVSKQTWSIIILTIKIFITIIIIMIIIITIVIIIIVILIVIDSYVITKDKYEDNDDENNIQNVDNNIYLHKYIYKIESMWMIIVNNNN